MTWLGILFWILTHARDLFSLIRQVLELINSIPKDQQKTVKDSIAAAIKTGDKVKVKQVLEKHCEGIACPAKPVGG